MIFLKFFDYIFVFLERFDGERNGVGGEILEMLEQNDEDIRDDCIHLTQAVTLSTDI